ncbi:MAG TPA: zinc-dependent metalloprotease, partial [Flavitalea sp.]|nr:zinc-dependent metalloprotease [Flavitalea sp.]
MTRFAPSIAPVLIAFACLYSSTISAQEKDTSKTIPGAPPVVKSTTTPPKTGPKPYKDVITEKTITRTGLFIVHKNEEKWFFEIRDSILGKDILVVNRISKAPINTRSGFFGYAGDEINENVIRFERGPNNKLFIRSISFSVYAPDSSKPMYRSVMNSNIQPIAAAFDIKAFSPDSLGSVIDVSEYLNGDNEIMFFAPSIKSSLRLGSLQSDKSYVVDIRNYPINTEIRTVKTYTRSNSGIVIGGPAPTAPSAGFSTFELNTSILLLPSKLMRPRFYDDRVSYINTSFTDFDADPQGVQDVSMVTRWRLDVRHGDLDKYKRGELVEPVKPILYYIDPGTPAKWIPYLIQGVNDWQKAFEKAGFKNAIIARVAPTKEEDSTWSMEDARYSAIVYKPSDIPNASGPHVHDPRTGEILESHINWYHNVMRLLRNWYLVQGAASDPRARKAVFSDTLMGQLIRFVSSHEVGHTLGLPHNMGASSATPVEKLRDVKWLSANGHTASIMDYARFNYVAQPEDKVGLDGVYPRINDYDNWAIEWGYRVYPDLSEEKEKQLLNKLVIEKSSNPRLRFLHADGMDPRAQTEDLGDNAMKAGDYAIKNLKRIVPELPNWLKEEGKDYTSLEEVYNEVLLHFQRYMSHAITNIGGIYTDNKTTEQPGGVFSIVPKATQKE